MENRNKAAVLFNCYTIRPIHLDGYYMFLTQICSLFLCFVINWLFDLLFKMFPMNTRERVKPNDYSLLPPLLKIVNEKNLIFPFH